MWYFIGYAVGIILILVILFNSKIYNRWSKYNRLRIIILSIVFIISAFVIGFRYISLNSGQTKQEIISLLFNADQRDVNYIRIYSPQAKSCTRKLKSDTIIIDDIKSIGLFISKVKKSHKIQLNHPYCYWKLKIEIHFLNDTTIFLDGEQSRDKENGFFITPYKKALYGKFPLGDYKNNELGEFLISFYEDD